MEALVLIGGVVCAAVFGFWVMGRIDRFVDSIGGQTRSDRSKRDGAVPSRHNGK